MCLQPNRVTHSSFAQTKTRERVRSGTFHRVLLVLWTWRLFYCGLEANSTIGNDGKRLGFVQSSTCPATGPRTEHFASPSFTCSRDRVGTTAGAPVVFCVDGRMHPVNSGQLSGSTSKMPGRFVKAPSWSPRAETYASRSMHGSASLHGLHRPPIVPTLPACVLCHPEASACKRVHLTVFPSAFARCLASVSPLHHRGFLHGCNWLRCLGGGGSSWWKR